ncbi:MAG: gamma-glutamyl-gamma-aminobutyrate hydrolase family protein [Gammaproteobacteria bacterium]|nr:gamma-glutamyl-gamma-aminobutyrate hydrolase family protein [Gammaproteobacteria bacterium]
MRRRKILVFQHVPFEPLGTLNPVLKEAGFRIRYVNFGRDPLAQPSLKGYSGLIVLGGPMNVDQVDAYPNLATEVELLREAAKQGMHVLGICLGAQLLAKALGARVSAAEEKEIGWYDIQLTEAGAQDELLGEFSPVQRIFQWHGDRFDLPSDAIQLASSDRCRNQAFRYEDRAYGFQFHLEVSQPLIERWLTTPAHTQELNQLADKVSPQQIRDETIRRIASTEDLSYRTFSRWAKRFGLSPRQRLRSR